MKYKLFFVDQPHQVDNFLMKNLGMMYNETSYHPRTLLHFACVTLDEEQLLMMKLAIEQNCTAYPVEE